MSFPCFCLDFSCLKMKINFVRDYFNEAFLLGEHFLVSGEKKKLKRNNK